MSKSARPVRRFHETIDRERSVGKLACELAEPGAASSAATIVAVGDETIRTMLRAATEPGDVHRRGPRACIAERAPVFETRADDRAPRSGGRPEARWLERDGPGSHDRDADDRDAQARARRLEREIESRARMVRGFAHDLKNPLGAADGHAQLLEKGMRGPLTEEQRWSVGQIRASLHSALDLIDDLLRLARAQAGHLELEWGATDVSDLLRSLEAEHSAAALQAGVPLRLVLPDTVPPIESDAGRVRQILGNLISNAIKYSEGGTEVVLRVRVEPARIVVDVTDGGRGVPEHQQARLFEEFWRADPRSTSGAGVGLSISRTVARFLGADLMVESAPGRGSTFSLGLPRHRTGPMLHDG